MSNHSLAFVALLIASPAAAADLMEAPPAPVVEEISVYDWSGGYLGIYKGGTWVNGHIRVPGDSAHEDFNGFTLGKSKATSPTAGTTTATEPWANTMMSARTGAVRFEPVLVMLSITLWSMRPVAGRQRGPRSTDRGTIQTERFTAGTLALASIGPSPMIGS